MSKLIGHSGTIPKPNGEINWEKKHELEQNSLSLQWILGHRVSPLESKATTKYNNSKNDCHFNTKLGFGLHYVLLECCSRIVSSFFLFLGKIY